MSRATIEISSVNISPGYNKRFHFKYFEVVFHWRSSSFDVFVNFGHHSLNERFEYDLISGFWDIPLLIMLGCLPLEVIFIWSIYKLWFVHFSLCYKFEYDQISGKHGCHEVAFHWKSSSFEAFVNFGLVILA